MNLFVNDKPVKIIKMEEFESSRDKFHQIISGLASDIRANDLVGHVAVNNPSAVLLYKLFALLREKKLKKLHTLSLAAPSKKILANAIKEQYKIIEAAGGVVSKGDRILLIHRLGKWDFPKGKLDKNEKFKEAAVREVEEECNIKVKLGEKICSTWHTYTQNRNRILKQTKWYAMTCLDDRLMHPQAEEDIDQILWADRLQAESLVATSYRSIQFVFRQYYGQKQFAGDE
jgi:8-oxo-dGTP pyrophosphatase MutT (NUDIX family)